MYCLGHFCQVVWRDTQKAGFGVARSKDGRAIYVVGRYREPGNYLNNYCENVPPPRNGVKYIPTNEELSRFRQYIHALPRFVNVRLNVFLFVCVSNLAGVEGTHGNKRCRRCNSKLYYYRRRSKKRWWLSETYCSSYIMHNFLNCLKNFRKCFVLYCIRNCWQICRSFLVLKP